MDIHIIMLAIVSAVLLLTIIILFTDNKSIHHNVDGLSDKIEDFLQDGEPIDFSTSDNHFSRLYNSVSDLENRYLLERSNTRKESKKNADFIADISHQLKTPLAAMRLYAEMLYAENPTSYSEKELQLIDKMEKLIFELLRLEKLKSDSYIMNFKTGEINHIVNSAVRDFQPLFPNKNYEVEGNSVFRFDFSWMSEALANVIKNASEHTAPDGTVKILIEDSEKSTIISVKDDGSGVKESELALIFERFHQTENASPNSAGIGLAITKAIVEKHHGTISAENLPNGFQIVICIPHLDGYETL